MADIPEEIITAIKLGNSKELSKYLGPNVDLTIKDKEGVYSKAQAELIIKDFFRKNPVKSFQVIHQGESKVGSQYTIGKLITEKETFRTMIVIKKTGNKFIIQRLSFEIEKE